MAMKRPAAAQGGEADGPQGPKVTELTEIAVARQMLEKGQISQEEFCKKMEQCPASPEAMRLWKKFEYSRSKNSEAQDTRARGLGSTMQWIN